MTLIFTNFHQLGAICDIRIDGTFNAHWNKQYIQIIQGKKKKKKYTKPDGVGSGLRSKPLKLKVSQAPNDKADLALTELAPAMVFNQIIYAIVSKSYPILYVGISEGGLQKGVLKDGRLRHHLHKMLAIRESGTSHTTGWLQHAMERYDANALAKQANHSEQVFKASLLDDVYIAIGHCGHDNWSSNQVEGTVLNAFEVRLSKPGCPVQVMNTATVKYDPIDIQLPGNIAHF
jgi:hypothetical protein